MSKMNAHLSVVRPALLAFALLLILIAMISPATAACAPGAKRTVILDSRCCEYPPAMVTKQNMVCNSSGVWVTSGSPYCATHSICEL